MYQGFDGGQAANGLKTKKRIKYYATVIQTQKIFTTLGS